MKCSTCCGAFILLIALSLPFVDVYQSLVDVMAHVPGTLVVNGLHNWLWLYTVKILPTLESYGLTKFEDCFDDKTEKRFILVLPKGGVAMTFGLTIEIARVCGIRVGSGYWESSSWPPVPLIPPKYDLDLYLGVNFWENEIKNEDFPCVALSRDPLERFISMYKYARDGGESGLLPHRNAMAHMNTTEEKVMYTWKYFGRAMMEIMHEDLMRANSRKNCVQVRVDDFFKGGEHFDKASKILLDGLKVKKSAQPKLLEAFKPHDISKHKATHSHVSGKDLEKGEEARARKFVQGNSKIMDVLTPMRKDLGYI